MFVILSGCQFSLPWLNDNKNPDNEVAEYQPSNEGNEGTAAPSQNNNIPGIELRPTVLYLADENNQGIVELKTEIPKVVGIAKSAISHLVNDVANTHLITDSEMKLPLPSNTRVIGATVKEDGLCKIDFSKELLNCTDKNHEQVAVDSIVYTLTEFETITSVQFMIEGEIKATMTHGTDISQPLKRK
ncbi:GerMN domain-containing protein [Clostridium sp. 'deep sea']|uniref:GerMN domain-containing protein n=1 Tax=Clostridium sp. 'deep sea' TaxID=2779445 RepID=UPI001896A4D4|nr:GerMN domain-containing protein [Clostridium sp. 'deep sea']QOR36396.1 GerMN domain-containing protein [Clostridium sp. 'deep sea']